MYLMVTLLNNKGRYLLPSYSAYQAVALAEQLKLHMYVGRASKLRLAVVSSPQVDETSLVVTVVN